MGRRRRVRTKHSGIEGRIGTIRQEGGDNVYSPREITKRREGGRKSRRLQRRRSLRRCVGSGSYHMEKSQCE